MSQIAQQRYSDGIYTYEMATRDNDKQVVLLKRVMNATGAAAKDLLRREFENSRLLGKQRALLPIEIVQTDKETFGVFAIGGFELLTLATYPPETPLSVLQTFRLMVHAVVAMHRVGYFAQVLRPENFAVGKNEALLTGLLNMVSRESMASQRTSFAEPNLPYLSPEQTGRLHVSADERSDLYSLGVILFEMLFGKLPFEAFDALGWMHAHLARQPEFRGSNGLENLSLKRQDQTNYRYSSVVGR